MSEEQTLLKVKEFAMEYSNKIIEAVKAMKLDIAKHFFEYLCANARGYGVTDYEEAEKQVAMCLCQHIINHHERMSSVMKELRYQLIMLHTDYNALRVKDRAIQTSSYRDHELRKAKEMAAVIFTMMDSMTLQRYVRMDSYHQGKIHSLLYDALHAIEH